MQLTWKTPDPDQNTPCVESPTARLYFVYGPALISLAGFRQLTGQLRDAGVAFGLGNRAKGYETTSKARRR